MTKDTLFLDNQYSIQPFKFTSAVADVFDDMVARSVPCYGDIIKLIVLIIMESVPYNGHIYDLGCSTGNTIKAILSNITDKNIYIDGIDSSAEMLQKATEKLSEIIRNDIPPVTLTQLDLNQPVTLRSTNAIILNLTVQFLDKSARLPLLTACYHALQQNGVVVIVEKVAGNDATEDEVFSRRFDAYKQLKGYSLQEIQNKKKAVASILQPLTIADNEALFDAAGFTSINQSFRWGNFVGWELYQ